MKCFYHSGDLDGQCSAAIVKYRYPECEMMPINYGQEFPWDKIVDQENVFMVDFCLQPFEQMYELWTRTDLIWIDHHKSAIDESKQIVEWWPNHRPIFAGVQEVGRAGCELTWQYLFPDRTQPIVVWLLGRYDVWDLQWPVILPFQYGMRMHDTDPNNQRLWQEFFACPDDVMVDPLHSTLAKGNVIMQYIKEDNKKYARACSFETELDGLKCIAINKGLTNSQLFDSVWDNQKYDAMLSFYWKDGKWTVSLYSDKPNIDVSVICKARGGGGHKGASGFQTKTLDFLKGA